MKQIQKKNKFNARKVEYKGMTFDSKKEFNRYLELKNMEEDGLIEDLQRQIRFELLPANDYFKSVDYIADFVYWKNGAHIHEDVKGLRKGAAYQLFKIKQKLMYHELGVIVREI